MKISHWLIVASFVAPMFACSTEDDDGDNGGSGGTAGSLFGGSGGGTGGGMTGGTGGGMTGGTGGGMTGGTGGGETGGTGGGMTGGTGGGETGGTGGGGTSDCTLNLGTPECTTCGQQKCEAQCVPFQSEATAEAFITCINACERDDEACLDACETQHPAAAKVMRTFDMCLGSQCWESCGGQSCMFGTGNPTCDACFTSKCKVECETCTANLECVLLLDCIGDCPEGDSACQQTCISGHQNGVEDLMSLLGQGGCLAAKCNTECS
ncbi:MAG: hypothetical protein MUF54_11840 [Polyangiaceae bacterium]|jgi:hypothetical protein|nr:hypothetical protein [Polyangiaceae bacterium]